MHVRVLNGTLHLHMFQRSADVPVGVPANMIQYAALTLMLAQLTGTRPGTFHHTMSDAHIYVDQLDAVHEMLAREPRRLPTLTLTEEGRQVTDIHDFRATHFALADYEPHPSIRGIPVAS
ncbi:thymidylate synthase [Klenkia terrae]|uniref:thymidylate synthase n=1 Tax=Klenkia terrae TaxID=1052259 RepID=UPI0036086664